MRNPTRRIPVDKQHVRAYLASSEVITEFRPPFITTTAQRACDESEAATFAYLVTGKALNGDLLVKKHPNIKGSPARKAIGG